MDHPLTAMMMELALTTASWCLMWWLFRVHEDLQITLNSPVLHTKLRDRHKANNPTARDALREGLKSI